MTKNGFGIGSMVKVISGTRKGKTAKVISKSIDGYYYKIEFDDVKNSKGFPIREFYQITSLIESGVGDEG